MAKVPEGMAASVRQRLLNLSREEGRVFDVVLVTYGLERLIYRLSVSEYRNSFILKGGMLVTLWTADEKRFTRDADFLGHGELSEDHLMAVFTEVMNIEVDDGLVFDARALAASPIREDQEYGGVRLKTVAYIGRTRIPITVDIGFGDAVVDSGFTIDYPSLLDMPSANIRAYPPATVIAEKFQAIVNLGLANGRMKDYYDLWAIPGAKAIEPAELDAAIRATFERRGTDIPGEPPVGLTPEFVNDEQKTAQWAAYTASIDLEGLSLDAVVETIWSYIGPACQRLTVE
jgi:hypothetical protein